MRNKFSFLNDPRSLAEIRKHKWLESQRQSRELGFATAALDWIKKYGEEWKRVHRVDDAGDYARFFERRRFRRFCFDCNIELNKDNFPIQADPVNISFFGLLCRSRDYLAIGSTINVFILPKIEKRGSLQCQAKVERVLSQDATGYEIFLKFDEYCQEEIQKREYLKN